MCCRLKIALFEFFARGQESCTRVMTTKLPCTLLYVVLLVRISHLISHFCFRYNKYQAEGLKFTERHFVLHFLNSYRSVDVLNCHLRDLGNCRKQGKKDNTFRLNLFVWSAVKITSSVSGSQNSTIPLESTEQQQRYLKRPETKETAEEGKFF